MITTLTADIKKLLLENFNFKNINDAKKDNNFKNLPANEIYSKLKQRFNEDLEKSNRLMNAIQEKKQEAKVKRLQKQI